MARSGSEKRQRTERRTLRFTAEEAAELGRRAACAGISEPAYVRLMCLEQSPARARRNATPNEELIARVMAHLACAADASRAGEIDAVQRELMLARHACIETLGAEP